MNKILPSPRDKQTHLQMVGLYNLLTCKLLKFPRVVETNPTVSVSLGTSTFKFVKYAKTSCQPPFESLVDCKFCSITGQFQPLTLVFCKTPSMFFSFILLFGYKLFSTDLTNFVSDGLKVETTQYIFQISPNIIYPDVS